MGDLNISLEIVINELLQAVDCFLIKINCPICKNDVLTGLENPFCVHCDFSAKDFYYILPERKNIRLLAGTQRKQKGGMHTFANTKQPIAYPFVCRRSKSLK